MNPAQQVGVAVPPGSIHIPSLLETGARFFTGLVEQKLGHKPGAIYDKGLGHIVAAAVQNPSIPQQPLTAVELARRAGILPEVNPPKHKRRRA